MSTVDRLELLKKHLILETEGTEQELNELRAIFDLRRQREYHSKFLKDFQKEKGKNVFPDHDEIYKRYDDYKSRCDRAIEYILEHSWSNGVDDWTFFGPDTEPNILLSILRRSDKE